MALFFLLAAFFFSAQADDAGRFGNYTGVCSLRPMEHDPKRNVMMCFPNKQKSLEIGDWVRVQAHKTHADPWAVNLLSSTYQVLFQIRFEDGKMILRSNLSPWGQNEGSWTVQHTAPTPLKYGEYAYVQLGNSAGGIDVEINFKTVFKFRHVAKFPGNDYKYLSVTKPSEDNIGVGYHTHLREFSYVADWIEEESNEVWRF